MREFVEWSVGVECQDDPRARAGCHVLMQVGDMFERAAREPVGGLEVKHSARCECHFGS